jgi:intracellular sulfur oxidation DsrE/DsrF family protein
MTQRREFLAKLGVMASAMALDADELRAATSPDDSPWDTSWIDRLASAQFRAVFNASDIGEGTVLSHALVFFDHFHELHGTTDDQTCPVIVFRRLGTQMAFNDHLWNRYEIGAERSVEDAATGAPAKRNIFWRAADGASPAAGSSKLQTLMQRGLISLVCDISVRGWSGRMAERTNQDAGAVRDEVLANLIPGAILVPSGIYALIRAQNAGAAYMPGG